MQIFAKKLETIKKSLKWSSRDFFLVSKKFKKNSDVIFELKKIIDVVLGNMAIEYGLILQFFFFKHEVFKQTWKSKKKEAIISYKKFRFY